MIGKKKTFKNIVNINFLTGFSKTFNIIIPLPEKKVLGVSKLTATLNCGPAIF